MESYNFFEENTEILYNAPMLSAIFVLSNLMYCSIANRKSLRTTMNSSYCNGVLRISTWGRVGIWWKVHYCACASTHTHSSTNTVTHALINTDSVQLSTLTACHAAMWVSMRVYRQILPVTFCAQNLHVFIVYVSGSNTNTSIL